MPRPRHALDLERLAGGRVDGHEGTVHAHSAGAAAVSDKLKQPGAKKLAAEALRKLK